MTNERLEQLKQRASKAQSVAEDIEQLTKATGGYDGGAKIGWQLRDQVWEAGKAALLGKKEQELEALLAEPAPVVVAAPVPPIAEVVC